MRYLWGTALITEHKELEARRDHLINRNKLMHIRIRERETGRDGRTNGRGTESMWRVEGTVDPGVALPTGARVVLAKHRALHRSLVCCMTIKLPNEFVFLFQYLSGA